MYLFPVVGLNFMRHLQTGVYKYMYIYKVTYVNFHICWGKFDDTDFVQNE